MWQFRKRDVPDVLDERLRRYAAAELPERLGLPPKGERRVTLGRFGAGRAARLRAVELEGFGKLVLRVFVGERGRRWLTCYPELYEALAAHGVPAPRLLFVDDSPATLGAYGFWVLGEEFIEGRPYAELPEAARDELLAPGVELLRRLHAIRESAAGRPWMGERWRPGARMRRELGERLVRLRPLDRGLSRRRIRRVAAWLGGQADELVRARFPLVHSDLGRTNLLLGRDGRLRLLDYRTSSHWFPQLDLYACELSLGRDDPSRAREVLGRYFLAAKSRPALSREQYEQTRPLFAAACRLGRAAREARRAALHEAKGQPGWEKLAEVARREWAHAQEFLGQAGAP